MKRLITAVATIFLLAGCSIPSLSSSGTRLNDACADKVAQAFTSTSVVPGSYACLDAAKQGRIAGLGITNDAGLAAINAANFPPNTVLVTVPCGPMKTLSLTQNHKYYDVTQGGQFVTIIEVVTNKSDGTVDKIYTGEFTSCPK